MGAFVYLLTGPQYERVYDSEEEAVHDMLLLVANLFGWNTWAGLQQFEPWLAEYNSDAREVHWRRDDKSEVCYKVVAFPRTSEQGKKAIRLAKEIDSLSAKCIETQDALAAYKRRLQTEKEFLHKLGQ